jgi:purine-binding chemotaxis protein CheW
LPFFYRKIQREFNAGADTITVKLEIIRTMTAHTSAETPKINTANVLIFNAGGLDCAFPLESVQEVVPMATLFSPPGLPSGLAGFLNLRGTAVPIIRLDRLFELPERPPGLHTPMIVLRGVSPTGILVDSVRAIVPMPSARLLDIPEGGTFRGCATAAFELDGEAIHLLSAAALLEASEGRLLADYGDMAQARLLHMERSMGHDGKIEENV